MKKHTQHCVVKGTFQDTKSSLRVDATYCRQYRKIVVKRKVETEEEQALFRFLIDILTMFAFSVDGCIPRSWRPYQHLLLGGAEQRQHDLRARHASALCLLPIHQISRQYAKKQRKKKTNNVRFNPGYKRDKMQNERKQISSRFNKSCQRERKSSLKAVLALSLKQQVNVIRRRSYKQGTDTYQPQT